MNERELQDLLRDMLEELLFARDDAEDPLAEMAQRTEGIHQTCTYDDMGMMTDDKGLLIECDDGSQFQVSIARRT